MSGKLSEFTNKNMASSSAFEKIEYKNYFSYEELKSFKEKVMYKAALALAKFRGKIVNLNLVQRIKEIVDGKKKIFGRITVILFKVEKL